MDSSYQLRPSDLSKGVRVCQGRVEVPFHGGLCVPWSSSLQALAYQLTCLSEPVQQIFLSDGLTSVILCLDSMVLMMCSIGTL